jgi:hypothetical protein
MKLGIVTKREPEKRKPVVLLPADVKRLGLHAFHVAGHKYLAAVVKQLVHYHWWCQR